VSTEAAATIAVAGAIAVVGASARAAAFSLLRAGYQVVAADLFADADLARCCPATRLATYPDGFADWLAQVECDSWLYTGALENYPELVDRLAKIRPLIGNSGESLRRVRNPLLLQKVLQQADFLFPETVAATAGRLRQGRWLGKTYQGSSGNGVSLATGAPHDVPYWQRRVSGTPLSAVFEGSELRGVTRQLVGEPWAGAAQFQYCGSIGPWLLSSKCERHLQQLGERLCQEFELTGWYGIDLIDSGDQLWIIEVNPRYTAAVEIVERAHADANACFGKAILFAKQPLTMDAQLCETLLSDADSIRWPRLADIPIRGTKIAIGQPVLTTFASATSVQAVEIELQRCIKELEQQLYV
jgi:predicted ATP-grasp superfamily ATP-dependent carboligase